MRRKLFLLFGTIGIILIAVIFIIGFYNRNTQKTDGKDLVKAKIVTSFYPMYIIALNLTDQIPELKVENLTGAATGCLHDYQITTKDMKTLSNADLLLTNGGGMEAFINDVLNNYPDLKIVDSSKQITFLNEEDEEVIDSKEQGQKELNAHVWLNPKLYIKQIENSSDGIKEYVKGQSWCTDDLLLKIDSNTQAYIDKVKKVDQEIDKLVLHQENNKVIVFHDAFEYLADRIGLSVAYAVEIDANTSLSAGEVADIINVVKEEKIKYLFTEKQYDSSIAKQIEAETGAKVYIIDSIVTGDGSKDSYLNAMYHNIDVLKEAFR